MKDKKVFNNIPVVVTTTLLRRSARIREIPDHFQTNQIAELQLRDNRLPFSNSLLRSWQRVMSHLATITFCEVITFQQYQDLLNTLNTDEKI